MPTFAAFLMSLVGPLAIKVITALGMSLITFTGVTVALQGLIDMATTNWASVPSDILALASIAGIPEAIGIICGAFVSRVGMWTVASATKWVTK